MELSRRGVLAIGAGAIVSGTGGFALRSGEKPRAWRVSFVDCDEPVVDGYGGARFYATLLTSRNEAKERLLETECFGPGRHEYLALDYDEFVVSVRTAVLPAEKSLETVSDEFDGDVLNYVVKVTGEGDADQEGEVMRHVLTTWELNGARKPARIQLNVQGRS